MFLTYLW